TQPWTKTQEDAERYGICAVKGVQYSRLAIERYVCPQSNLAQAVMHQIVDAAESISADSERGVKRRGREQFILIDQFEASVGIITLQEVDVGLKQITVLICILEFLVLAPPDHCCRPITRSEWPVISKRSCLAFLTPRFQSLGMNETSEAVVRRPVATRSYARTWRPRVQRRGLNAPPLFVRLTPVEDTALDLEPVDHESRGYHAKAGVCGIESWRL